jgi:hypothetical protein
LEPDGKPAELDKEEEEADRFAANQLIPPEEYWAILRSADLTPDSYACLCHSWLVAYR